MYDKTVIMLLVIISMTAFDWGWDRFVRRILHFPRMDRFTKD